MNNRAFTLLELLVVITIIGILASIVVVSMSGSTDSATIAKGKAYTQQVHALLGHQAVGVWNFDEGTEDTCSATADACDISGHGSHGTFYGDTQFVDSDIEGYALSFDGVGDYVDTGDNPAFDGTSGLTLLAWIKINTTASDNTAISKYENTDNSYLIGHNDKIKGWWFRVSNGLNYINATFVTDIDTNIWYHLVGTYNGTAVRLYVNGVEKDNIPFSGNIPDINANLWFGNRNDNWGTFNGLIDEIRIYAEALPSTEIQKHYVQGLKKLLSNQAITQIEYDQRMEEFNQYLVSNKF
jgi:prepilin-type N-terminal cleavage/methylation domain-containing protein